MTMSAGLMQGYEDIPTSALLNLIGKPVELTVAAGHRHGGMAGAQAPSMSYVGILSLVIEADDFTEFVVGNWRVTVPEENRWAVTMTWPQIP